MSFHAHKIRLESGQCTLRSNKVMKRHILEEIGSDEGDSIGNIMN
jgi:hypothetical protein